MISLTSNMSDKHRQCWELLPWVANERISPSDLKRIQPHLRECSACQEELASQRRLRELMRADESIVIAPQASFQKLMQRIEAEEESEIAEAPRAAKGTSRSAARAARPPRWLAIAAGVQAVIIGLLLAVTWFQAHALLTAPRFSTLTTPATVPQGPVIRVVFREEVTIGELNEIVRSLGAHIVAGPNSAGVYTLQLEGEQRTSKHVEQVAAQLRQDSRVLFSEPAFAEIAPR